MRIGVFLVAVLMACGALAAPATAQDADARELFRRGEAAYSVGNYDLAIREWGAAYALDPRPRIQFNLAQAYERLGRLEEASDSLKKFLDSGDPDDPMYSDANARLAALQQRLSLTGVIVKGGPDGGKIFVDDREWGRTPRPDKIPLSPVRTRSWCSGKGAAITSPTSSCPPGRWWNWASPLPRPVRMANR